MTRSPVVRACALWLALTACAAVASHARYRIEPIALPSDALASWSLRYLREGGDDGAERWEGPGPNVITAWRSGVIAAQYVGDGDLVHDVRRAREAFADERARTGAAGSWAASPIAYTVEVGLGSGPVHVAVPYLRELSLVPLHEGLTATIDLDGERERRVLSPEMLRGAAAYDGGIATPIPDLGLGTDVRGLVGRMARDLGLRADTLFEEGIIERYRSHTISAETYPRDEAVNAETLAAAVRDAAAFLLRHQSADGKYTYVYDARTGGPRAAGYNLPRHSGTTYFVAQVYRVFHTADARRGSQRALRFLERNHLRNCGDELCIADEGGRVDVGSAALTVVAAAEVLMGGEDALARRLVDGLSGFLRAQQREDGELMHEFDLTTGEPIDVQHLYYSGEAAFALLRAYRATGDPRNLEAVSRLMVHLTGASWDFFGSRYYYGEEHWTCIAAGEAIGLETPEGEPADLASGALDFCQRWYEWNEHLQFRAGQTPWPVEGGYGVGPVVVPRLTPVGSRSEAFIGTYLMMQDAGVDTAGVRALVERGLGQLLRYRWAPGPTHLFADPAGARGGVPGSPTDLTSRNDFTQHAGSSWIRWYEVLQGEAQPAGEESAP
ncbi:MAG: hypothetical protein AAF411_10900 [Myxococcota bacterium]